MVPAIRNQLSLILEIGFVDRQMAVVHKLRQSRTAPLTEIQRFDGS
jgi:hypothetical protein